jgi:uncharacterized membrane protein
MKRLFKQLSIFLLVVLTVLSFGSAVQAADDFQVDFIKVNGMTQDLNAVSVLPIYVERDSYITVEVFLHGLDGSDVAYDTKVSAWIGGYEYGDIDDVTPIFQTLPGVQDRKVLTLEIPNDLESSKTYTLNVDIYDDEQREYNEFPLVIEETRHELNIYDATFNPGKVVKAGTPLFVSIRLENLGDNAEDSIKVISQIAELGISSEQWMDELETWNGECDDCDNEDDAASTGDMMLFIPSDATPGDYTVELLVEYDRGHSTAKKAYTITVVEGANAPSSNAGESTMVTSVTTAQAVEAGEGAAYKLNIANMGETSETYTFAVRGTEGWATYSVDPSALTVAADGTAEVNVYVSPSESTTEGVKTFTVDVLSGDEVVGNVVLTLDVEDDSSTSAKEVLLIIFLVLIAVLVLLGIVLVIKKLASRGEDDNIEGQTYY